MRSVAPSAYDRQLMHFIAQPFDQIRLGDFLISHLADPQWTAFRAAIAFVKRSGTQYIRQPLRDFSARGGIIRISVGIDLFGTSTEGLAELLEATPPASIFVYRNNGPNTFHPKVYVFKSADLAEVIVGSGNLTGGGLFTNYEASLAVALDLRDAEDASFLQVVEATLDAWSHAEQGTCYELTRQLLDQLVASGLVRSEAALAAATAQRARELRPVYSEADQGDPAADAQGQGQAPQPPLFASVPVPAPPALAGAHPAPEVEADNAAEAAEPAAVVVALAGIVPAPAEDVTSFVMTLQQTDVGVGQTTAGTSRRSPEVFIPLAALDQHPGFWGFPAQFTPDVGWNNTHTSRRNGHGKLDRMDVPMRIGMVQSVRMFFNPRKGDFRLGNEALRSSGKVGDILLITRVDAASGFEYDIQVAPQGSPLFAQLAPLCTTTVPNSQKKFGYF